MVFQAKQGADVEKTVADTQFKIATNSKLFSILSDSIYTRKIPEDLSLLHGNPRKAFIKFCARLHNGTESAGPDICGAKTLAEMKTVIFGF